jgi:hypothetical protein
MALAGGLMYDDQNRIYIVIVNDALSIGKSILRPANAQPQDPGKLNPKYAIAGL